MILQKADGILSLHICTQMPLDVRLLTERNGVTVVTLPTLMACMRDAPTVSGAAHMESEFVDILIHASDNPHTTIAFCRVPGSEAQTLRLPNRGYRFMGRLSEVFSGYTAPSIFPDQANDVLAVVPSTNSPEMYEYSQIWGPAEVALESHFCIILTSPPTPSPLLTSSLGPLNMHAEFDSSNSQMFLHSQVSTPVHSTGMFIFYKFFAYD